MAEIPRRVKVVVPILIIGGGTLWVPCSSAARFSSHALLRLEWPYLLARRQQVDQQNEQHERQYQQRNGRKQPFARCELHLVSRVAENNTCG